MINRKIVLRFPRELVDKPIICRLVKDYQLDFNILKASVTPNEEGLLVLELSGEKDKLDQAIKFLKKTGVTVQPLSQDIKRNDERCTHCGACVVICPTGALYLDEQTREVIFDNSKCIACELCIKPCPPRAMEVHF
jgi:ferredoxin